MAQAGDFTDEQMLALAEHADELAAAFQYVSGSADAAAEATRRAADEMAKIAEERARLEIELLRAQGRETEAVARERERELAALDVSNRALQEQIWAEEEAAAAREAQYQAATEAARRNADAQRDAINAQADAQREAYQRQVEAAREFISDLTSVVNTVESTLRSLGYVNDEVASLDRARAVRQLSALADSGRTPTPEEVDRIASGLTGSSGVYATQEQATMAESLIQGDLRAVQSRAERELEAAEAQVERLDRQADLISEWRDRQLEQAQSALERQLAQADSWRTAEISALESIGQNTRAGTEEGPLLRVVETPAQREQVEEVRGLRADLVRVNDNQQYTQDLLLELLRQWDRDGLPHPRNEGQPAAYVFGYEG
jgi:hypothetical protein